MDSPLIKKPSAWIPIALSIVMLSVIGLYLTNVLPPDPTGDEGVGAHLFQIWLMLEVIFIPIFVIINITKNLRQTLLTLVIQVLLVLVVCAPVFYFKW